MPNQPKTPNHSVRVPDDTWNPAKTKAAGERKTMTRVINELIKEWTQRP